MDAAIAAFQDFVDYAGLYPPASLSLPQVIANYARYRTDSASWMLGRLIVPADRLADADALAAVAGARSDAQWRVSVLVGGADDVSRNADLVAGFRSRDEAVLSVNSVEAVATSPEAVRLMGSSYPPEVDRFLEIPAEPDPAPLLAEIAACGCAAKIRTGGVTADTLPSTLIVARFLARANRAGVQMKATAGLHHAVRGERRLTYSPDSPAGVMHGFANLTFAAVLLAAGKIDEDLADALLDDDRPEVFKFGGRAGSWLNAVVTYGEFAHARQSLLRSVGSCSFDEPVTELRALGWIA